MCAFEIRLAENSPESSLTVRALYARASLSCPVEKLLGFNNLLRVAPETEQPLEGVAREVGWQERCEHGGARGGQRAASPPDMQALVRWLLSRTPLPDAFDANRRRRQS